MMRRRWLLPLIAPLLVAVVAAGACGDDEATTGTPPTSSATGQGGGAGAGGQPPGVPRFGDARILVGGQFRPTRLVLDGDFLYWTTRGGTAGGGAAPLGGSGGAGGAGGSTGPGGAGAAPSGSGGGDGEIVILGAVVRVRKTGGTPSTVVTAPSVTGLTVAGPHVYFTVLDEQEVGSIAVVPAEGGEPFTVLDGLGWPADVAVGDDLLYWSEVGTEGGLWVAPRPAVHFDVGGGGAGGGISGSGGQGGTSGVERIHSGSALLTFLAIDEETLYFSDHGVAAHEGAIGAVPLGSTDADLIVEGIDRPRYFAVGEDHLYVVTEGDGQVQRFAKSGSGSPTVLAYDQDRPYGIAVDDRAVYWTNSGTAPPAGECEAAVGTIMAMPLGGGEAVELAANQACPLAIAVDDTGLYWINVGRDSDPDSGAVMRMPKR